MAACASRRQQASPRASTQVLPRLAPFRHDQACASGPATSPVHPPSAEQNMLRRTTPATSEPTPSRRGSDRLRRPRSPPLTRPGRAPPPRRDCQRRQSTPRPGPVLAQMEHRPQRASAPSPHGPSASTTPRDDRATQARELRLSQTSDLSVRAISTCWIGARPDHVGRRQVPPAPHLRPSTNDKRPRRVDDEASRSAVSFGSRRRSRAGSMVRVYRSPEASSESTGPHRRRAPPPVVTLGEP